MATAKRDTETVTRQETVTVKEVLPVVRLTLSKDEAEALASILLNVGGSVEHGRGHADSIVDALEAIVPYQAPNARKFATQGAIYFTTREKARTY